MWSMGGKVPRTPHWLIVTPWTEGIIVAVLLSRLLCWCGRGRRRRCVSLLIIKIVNSHFVQVLDNHLVHYTIVTHK